MKLILLVAFSCLNLLAQVNLSSPTSPPAAEPGVTLVTLTGTNFPAGAILPAQVTIRVEPQSAGAGPAVNIAATGVQTVVGSTRRVTFSLPVTLVVAAPAAYNVTLSGTTATGTAFNSTNPAQLTVQPIPGILSAVPAAAQPGQAVAMLIRTQFANFVQGAADASLGAGVSVGVAPIGNQAAPDAFGNAGRVIVVDPNTLLTVARVAGTATAGNRELTLRQGPQTYRRPDALSIHATSSNAETSLVTLTSPPTPGTGTPGITTFTLSTTGLPAGTLIPNQIRLFLEPRVDGAGAPALTLTPTTVGADSSGSRSLTFQVPANVSFAAATEYLITLYGSTSNYGQSPGGITFLSGNRALVTLGPPQAPSPIISTLNPTVGVQGQTLAVTVTAQNTNFVAGHTVASFGPGISVGGAAPGQFGPVAVNGSAQVIAQVQIANGANLGTRDVELRTGQQIAKLLNGFQVLPGATLVTLSAIQPAIVRPGGVASMFGTGFPAGSLANPLVTLTPARPGAGPVRTVVAASISAESNGARQVTFLLPADLVFAQPETYLVAVSGPGFSTGAGTSLIVQPLPRLTSVIPNSGQRGQAVNVTLHGQFTDFTAGVNLVNFGPGIAVGSINPVNATQLTAVLTIAANAAIGARNVSVTTGADVATLPNGFTVSGAPISLSLSGTTTPATARPGDAVAVTASNFPAGDVTTAQVVITLEPVAGGAPILALATSIQNNGNNTRVIRFTIPSGVAAANYLVSAAGANLAGVAFTSANKAALTVQAPSAPSTLSSITPNSGAQGQTMEVDITGQNTAFVAGNTLVSFGTGITVNSVSVNSPTTISAIITIANTATVGPRTVSVTTGAQSVALNNGFAVTATVPSLSSLSPTSGTQGQSLAVNITGQNTAFAQGTTQVSFGAGIIVSNVTVQNALTLSAQIALAADAAVGPRTVTITTGAQVVTGAFQVNASAPAPTFSLTSVTPAIGATGTTVPVTIIGAGTAFQQGVSIVDFGAGISPGPLTVTSATQLSTNLTIASNATPGSRTVTVTTGAQVATLTDAFAVIGPQISLSSPSDKSFVNTPSITVAGTVNDPAATVAINGVAAPNIGGSFTVAIPLSEGNNTVTAVATGVGGATSSTSVLVNLDTTPPRIAVLTPVDQDETTEERINVAGNVNDIVVGTVNEIQAQVTVNGVAAEVNNRSFVARSVPLQAGLNTLQVVGRDRVGNAFTTSVKVTRVMAPLLKINVISGNNQSAPINTQLPQPIVVQLTDGLGIPKPNTPVFFRVAGNNGRVGGALAVEVRTDAQGQAQTQWTIGSRSGAGINRLEVGATGVTAPAVFTANGTPSAASRIVVDSGLNQTGAVGQKLPLPFVAVVIDEGNNRLGGVPVTLTIRAGGGKFDGQDTLTVTSDPDGRVAQTLTLGPQEGIENNEVVVSFAGNISSPAIFTASGRVPKRVEDTKVSGVVLDNGNQPIPGVTVKLLKLYQGSTSNLPEQVGGSAVSNNQGFFEILNAPIGVFKLLADGTTAQSPNKYPTLEFDITTVAGQDNSIGMPVFLPALNPANRLCVDEQSGGTLTLQDVPGFSLTLLPGSATFPGGTKQGCISVTSVNIDKVPMTPGFGQQPKFVVTIQPVGTIFNPPAAIALPNVDGLAPHAITEMYSYDHDLAAFVSIGQGQVDGRGLLFRSVAGSGVIKAGWHCGGDPTTTGTPADCRECRTCNGTRCVVDDTRGCDDGLFCTSCSGDTAGPDCCKGGNCENSVWPDAVTPGTEVDILNAPVKLIGAFSQLAEISNRVGKWLPCGPEVSLTTSFKQKTTQACCEETRSVGGAFRYTGQAEGSVGVTCDIGLGAIPFLDVLIDAGFEISVSGGVNGEFTAFEANDCTSVDSYGRGSGTISFTPGAIKAKFNVLSGLLVDASLSASFPPLGTSLEYSVNTGWKYRGLCYGPVEAKLEITLIGFQVDSKTFPLVPRRCLR
jgi:hypothetical protein